MYKLTLTDEKDEKLSTVVENKDEITSISIGYDIIRDETVVYAFDSNAEIYRESGMFTSDEMAETINDFYSFSITEVEQ